MLRLAKKEDELERTKKESQAARDRYVSVHLNECECNESRSSSGIGLMGRHRHMCAHVFFALGGWQAMLRLREKGVVTDSGPTLLILAGYIFRSSCW
jgi:hypothetical protein